MTFVNVHRILNCALYHKKSSFPCTQRLKTSLTKDCIWYKSFTVSEFFLDTMYLLCINSKALWKNWVHSSIQTELKFDSCISQPLRSMKFSFPSRRNFSLSSSTWHKLKKLDKSKQIIKSDLLEDSKLKTVKCILCYRVVQSTFTYKNRRCGCTYKKLNQWERNRRKGGREQKTVWGTKGHPVALPTTPQTMAMKI